MKGNTVFPLLFPLSVFHMDLKQMLTLNSDSADPGDPVEMADLNYICVFIWVQNIEPLKKRKTVKRSGHLCFNILSNSPRRNTGQFRHVIGLSFNATRLPASWLFQCINPHLSLLHKTTSQCVEISRVLNWLRLIWRTSVGMSASWKSRHSSQVSAATAYLGGHLHKEQIPAVLTLRKPSRQDSQTNALPIKATILTVCSQEHRLSVMTPSLHLHDSMSGDLFSAQGAILIGETSWESMLRCGRKGWCFSSSWSPIYFVP